jgi:hypothetical protein
VFYSDGFVSDAFMLKVFAELFSGISSGKLQQFNIMIAPAS